MINRTLCQLKSICVENLGFRRTLWKERRQMLVCVGVGRDMIGKWSEQNGAVYTALAKRIPGFCLKSIFRS